MKPLPNYMSTTGWLTLLGGILALACNVLLAMAVDNNFDVFTNPALIFNGLKSAQITCFRWGMLTDLWGYYLLLTPAIFMLHQNMQSPFRHLISFSGLAYVLFGAIGAAILAATGTDLLEHYLSAESMQQTAHKADFLLVYSLVNDSIWNLLEMGLLGVFMLGVASNIRTQSKMLYYLTLVLGFAGVLDSLGNTFGFGLLSAIGLNTYLALAPVWAIWLGIKWVRQ